jgi:DNA invertase Pin-like site-specific DNA recombinase
MTSLLQHGGEDNMKRVAIYGRVSTKRHQDVDVQLIPLREYAKHRGWEIQAEYVDVGISGSKAKRPALDKLMTAARQRAFDVVLVFRFDRFDRSSMHLATALAEFQSLGIDFASHNEAIDTSTPMGKMVFSVLVAVAELELGIIRERVSAGVAKARKLHEHWGRPKAIFDRQEAFKFHREGLGSRAIAERLGVGKDTVLAALAERQ